MTLSLRSILFKLILGFAVCAIDGRAIAACKFASEISQSYLEDGEMAKELNVENSILRIRYNQLFEFFRAGGKGRLVKYIEKNDQELTYDSGPYLIVSQLPEAALKDSNVLWLKDESTLRRVRKVFSTVPVILESSLLNRAAVNFLGDLDGTSIPHELKRCGYLSDNTQLSLSITAAVTESVVEHEEVHLSDYRGGLVDFLRDLKSIMNTYNLDESIYQDVRSFVMEQRAYTRQINYLKQKVRAEPQKIVYAYSNLLPWGEKQRDVFEITRAEELQDQTQLANRVFEKHYSPDLQSAFIKIKNKPDAIISLQKLIKKYLLNGPIKLR